MDSNTYSSRLGGGSGGRCAACKTMKRKCVKGCIFAPYFDADTGAAAFAAVHKLFGASNLSKLLLQIPIGKRVDAIATLCYEAQARLRDPVYGCVAHIFALQQQQVVNLQAELSILQTHLEALQELPLPPAPTLPSPSGSPSTGDLSTFVAHDLVQPASLHQQQQLWSFRTNLPDSVNDGYRQEKFLSGTDQLPPTVLPATGDRAAWQLWADGTSLSDSSGEWW
ncbi:unnamed protein product [Musa textilis]